MGVVARSRALRQDASKACDNSRRLKRTSRRKGLQRRWLDCERRRPSSLRRRSSIGRAPVLVAGQDAGGLYPAPAGIMVRGSLRLAPWTKKAADNILLRPFVGFGYWYSDTAKKFPFATGLITTGLKTTAADLFAQKILERRKEVDWRRNATFTCFGFAYLGCFQYYLYNNVFQRLCHPLRHKYGQITAIGAKVFLDQAVHHPFLYFPVFYSIKALTLGEPMVPYAITKYKAEIWESVKALWTVWVPAQFLNFSMVPLHFRIPYVAGVSFLWTVILSVMQGIYDRTKAIEEPKGEPQVVIEELD